MKNKNLSPKKSLKGWKLKQWLFKNKDTVKLLITGILALVAASFSDVSVVKLLFGAGGAMGTKLILDTLDFYTTDVNLKNEK